MYIGWVGSGVPIDDNGIGVVFDCSEQAEGQTLGLVEM